MRRGSHGGGGHCLEGVSGNDCGMRWRELRALVERRVGLAGWRIVGVMLAVFVVSIGSDA